ncbi:hypothetical protein A3L04_09915 [Thermococcus chitonophagus]|uniref:Protein-glutamine gamma-glutamyltransferase-like C-terminal domain-containing protein n=1 Tax=Thermococcus chitonophagus TaxID=54262 RepID=A0A161KIU5_9EURY|nr:DUF4129 domain-containing protein [Thermococcus chitonophagus]ASJ17363.1 hypothetical protein A3L04_09915 [Thermococcus chitonophagus]CUX77998.1 hypothetical protein CHITON_1219 [Thermococcus chitonophagus]
MRARIVLLFIVILAMIGLIRGTAHSEWGSLSADVILEAIVFIYIFAAIVAFIFLILIREKDIEREDMYNWKFSLKELILYGLSFVMVMVYFFIITKGLKLLAKSPKNETSTRVAVGGTSPTLFRPPVMSKPVPTLISYIPIILLLTITVFLGLEVIRGVRTITKKRQVKRTLTDFDIKLQEKGLDLFSNPREAVIELYKKAVLWLEVLGIPYKESWTHWEHAEKVAYKRRAYVELARLFEKAKYAPDKVTYEDAEKAYKLYQVIKGES